MDETRFYEMLCCPACRGELSHDTQGDELECPSCSYTFPIVDGIPVMFPCNVKDEMGKLFERYWDSAPQAELYDTHVEGQGDVFGIYNHEAEIYALTRYYRDENVDVVLDAGCGNGRFFETFSDDTVKIGVDASLNLLRRTRQRSRGDFLVCAELEHLPFKNETFGTTISCRVLQHLSGQEEAVQELSRVTRDGGDVILELYNTLNLKTVYKNIRMNPRLSKVFNAPFRMLFRSMSPFEDWGISYDTYNNWFQTKKWMVRTGLREFTGRGTGFGHHKYLLTPFYIDAAMRHQAPGLREWYYDIAFKVEKAIGDKPPFRWTLEKFVIRGTKNATTPSRSLALRVVNKVARWYKSSAIYNAAAKRERQREVRSMGGAVGENSTHLREAVSWLERAQDATPDRGVARGYSVGWTAHMNIKGWQPSYPETTGYIIPTFFDCAEYLSDPGLASRAIEMADWEIDMQLDSGAVRGGTIVDTPSPAVFNTGQVILGWLRCFEETKDDKYLLAAGRAAVFLLEAQDDDGAWRKSNSRFAKTTSTTYNARVGWALILYGQRSGNDEYVAAGKRSLEYTMSQQLANGWFENNCLVNPLASLTHTICYATEGLLGGYDALGDPLYLARAVRVADQIIERIQDDGCLSGQFDRNWVAKTSWSCLTGNAQLAALTLRLYAHIGEIKYRSAAHKLLDFLKRTQNCISDDPGLRGGVKGSYPFDGGYGCNELLNWATKFFIDALLLEEMIGGSKAERADS